MSVSIEKCEYFEGDGRFKGRIVTRNHGTVAANNIDLRIDSGGFVLSKQIVRVSIQPKNKLTYTFSLPMTSNEYAIGRTVGNQFNVLIQGSYKGLAGIEYKYSERQDYDPELRRFVPIWAE